MMPSWVRLIGRRTRFAPGLALLLEDDFNLLPYRHLRVARLRRRRALEYALAGCLGLIGALASGYGQQAHAAQAEARRVQLERQLRQLAPGLAEHAQLTQAIAATARRANLISGLAVSRDDLFHLLLAIGHQPNPGLVLDEIRYRSGHATVTGAAPDQHGLSAWVHQLESAIGLGAVEIADIQKLGAGDRSPRRGARTTGAAPVGFSLQIELGEASPERVAGHASQLARPTRGGGTPSATQVETRAASVALGVRQTPPGAGSAAMPGSVR